MQKYHNDEKNKKVKREEKNAYKRTLPAVTYPVPNLFVSRSLHRLETMVPPEMIIKIPPEYEK